MNYEKHYDLLIERAKTRISEGYFERHHIIPKCLGGTNEKENLVKLTAEEHYLAHQLLVKMHPGNNKLIFAASMMTVESTTNIRVNNKRYGWLKRKIAQALSENNIGKKKPPRTEEHKRKNAEANRGKKRTPEQNRRNSESHQGKVMPLSVRNKISKKLKGIPRKPHKTDTIEKIKVARSKQILTQERNDKIGSSFKNKIWINDGSVNKRINYTESMPAGFNRGRANYKR